MSYWSIDKLVTVSWILLDLFNSSCPRTLQGYDIALPRKQVLILQILHRQPHWLVDKTANIKKVIVLNNGWNASMIAYKVIFIVCESRLNKAILSPSVADQNFV